MPQYKERRQTSLKCQDCGHEFMGPAEYVVHTIEEHSRLTQSKFLQADAKCKRCESHAVTLRDA
jgi:Zn finger protein HypA/HybF involved in hydrogenase expression